MMMLLTIALLTIIDNKQMPAHHLVSSTRAQACSGMMCHNENVSASVASTFMNLSSTETTPPSPCPRDRAV